MLAFYKNAKIARTRLWNFLHRSVKEPIGLSDGNDGIHENKKKYESAHPQ